jgi:hypothetical protein
VTAFNSMRHQELAARQELVDRLSRAERMQLHRDLDEVDELVRGLDAGGTRSLVVFKSGAELNRVALMPVATADSLTIDVDPFISPLEAVLEEQLPVLVVEVSREDAQLWSVHLRRWERVETLRAMAPTDPVDASRPGKVQRRRETHLKWHLRSTAEPAGHRSVDDSRLRPPIGRDYWSRGSAPRDGPAQSLAVAPTGASLRNASSPPSTSTATRSPSPKRPSRICSASGSWTRRWIVRLSGRAP